jgi:hypothetical protein
MLATEDELSEAVALRLLREFPTLHIGTVVRRNGNGYLRARMRNFCEIAHRSPVLVVTDLDTNECPAALVSNWLGRLSRPATLLLRVAVREIESWLLADHAAMATLLGPRAVRRLPELPDAVRDPKETLLVLARRAARDVRLDLCAERGAIARQGLGYNARLCQLVTTEWRPERAEQRSPSLRRAMLRLHELASRA